MPDLLLADMYKHTIVVPVGTVVEKTAAPQPAPTPGPQPTAKPSTPSIIPPPPPVAPPPAIKAPVPPPPNLIYGKTTAPPAATQLAWLGSFNKKIMILVNDPTAVHLAENELALLTKMLEALKLSIADVALVNTARHAGNMAELLLALPATTVLLFGVEPFSMNIPMRFPYFQIQRWNDQVYVYSPSLLQLNTPSPDQVSHKKSLWITLQEVFK